MNTPQTIGIIGLTLFVILLLSEYDSTPKSPSDWKVPFPYNKIRHSKITRITPLGVIASTEGGLGNQLFKFACAYTLSKKLGIPLYVNLEREGERQFLLNKFSIPMNQIDNLGSNSEEIVRKIMDEDILFNQLTPELISTKFLYHIDYCESELFFREYKVEIKAMFILENDPAKTNHWAKHWIDLIENVNSTTPQQIEAVAVHIRRGDFEKSWQTPMRFFRLAMTQMIEKLKEQGKIPRFYIFSDSMERAQKYLFYLGNVAERIDDNMGEHINKTKVKEMVDTLTNERNDLLKKVDPLKDVLYISGSKSPEGKELSAVEEFNLMTKCRHMIVSFSTFSWWGAYLMENENKIIMRPTTNPNFYDHYETELQRMFKKVVIEKYWYPSEWIQIDPFFK